MDILDQRKRSIEKAVSTPGWPAKRTTIRIPDKLKLRLDAYEELIDREYAKRLDDIFSVLNQADLSEKVTADSLVETKELLQGQTSRITITLPEQSQEHLDGAARKLGVTRDEAIVLAMTLELKATTLLYREHLANLRRLKELFIEVFDKAPQWPEIGKLCEALRPLEVNFTAWEYSPSLADALWDDISNDLDGRINAIQSSINTIDPDAQSSATVVSEPGVNNEIPTHKISRGDAGGLVLREGGNWWLLPGSTTLARTTESMPDHIRAQRKKCLEDGSLVQGEQATHYLVAQGIKFKSSSALACFVTASSQSGPRCVIRLSPSERTEYKKSFNELTNLRKKEERRHENPEQS